MATDHAEWNRRAVPPNVAKVVEEMEMYKAKLEPVYNECMRSEAATKAPTAAMECANYRKLVEWLRLLRGESR